MVKKTMDGRDQFDAKVKLYNKMIHIGGEQQRTFIEIYYTKEAAEISMVIDDSFPAPITSQTGSLTPPTGRIFDTMRYFKIEYQVIKK